MQNGAAYHLPPVALAILCQDSARIRTFGAQCLRPGEASPWFCLM